MSECAGASGRQAARCLPTFYAALSTDIFSHTPLSVFKFLEPFRRTLFRVVPSECSPSACRILIDGLSVVCQEKPTHCINN